MSNEEQVADTIEMLYERLNSYNKQDLFNYGYLLESNEILCKDIEEKDKEIERLNNTIKGLDNTIENLEEVIKHKDSIIKEAIEYIEERYNGEVLTHTFDKDNVGELLEILDKVSDNEC